MNSIFRSLHFEITNKCNLRCKHCYNIKYLKNNMPDLSTSEAKEVIEKAISLGCEDIGFSGGEPFAREDIVELINYVKNYPIHILTNGLLITEEILKQIKMIGDLLIEFRVSLDGLSSHKNLRGVSFKNVINKIKLLIEEGFVVTVNTMLTQDNIQELNEMYNILKNLKIDRWRIDFIFNSGNARNNHIENNVLLNNFEEIKKLIIRYVYERPNFELDVNKMFRSSFLSYAQSINYDLLSKPCSYQGALTIRPNADVSFCPSMEITHGNILTDSIEDIINSPSWQRISNIRMMDLHKKCIDCKYLFFCGGGCRADSLYSSGSLYKNCNFTCKLVKYYIEEIYPIIKEHLI